MKDCPHSILEWRAMPSVRLENGTDDCFYQLFCASCGHMFDSKTYLPSYGLIDLRTGVITDLDLGVKPT